MVWFKKAILCGGLPVDWEFPLEEAFVRSTIVLEYLHTMSMGASYVNFEKNSLAAWGRSGRGYLPDRVVLRSRLMGGKPTTRPDLFWEDRFIVIPIILGFGVQIALYTILKKRLFVPVENTASSGAITGASGTTSALAMVACCARHITDVLPILGLTAAATFLAEYQKAFMLVGLGTTYAGIAVMIYVLIRERNKSIKYMKLSTEAA